MPGITKKTSATSLTITINIIITTAIIKQQQKKQQRNSYSSSYCCVVERTGSVDLAAKSVFFSDGWFPLHGLGILLAVTRTLTRTLSYIVISILLARLVLPLFSSKA